MPRTFVSTLLGLCLLIPVVGASSGCIVRTEPHRHGYHREREHTHRHCHIANGPRHRRVCHTHPHGPRHHD